MHSTTTEVPHPEITTSSSTRFCSPDHCTTSKWISKDKPSGTGDHERFRSVISKKETRSSLLLFITVSFNLVLIMYGAFKFGSNFHTRHHTRSKSYDWYIMMVINGIGEHQVNMVSTVSMPYSLLKNAMTLNIGIFRIADGDRKSIYF